MNPNTVLWIYIILLVVGGLIGFLKAGSKASLIASSSFALALILANQNIVLARNMVDVILGVLLLFFAMRLTKSKKFMPNGMMLILTIVALALRHL